MGSLVSSRLALPCHCPAGFPPHTPQNGAGVVSSLGSLKHQETFGHITLRTGLISAYRAQFKDFRGFLDGSVEKNLPVSQEPQATWIQSLG